MNRLTGGGSFHTGFMQNFIATALGRAIIRLLILAQLTFGLPILPYTANRPAAAAQALTDLTVSPPYLLISSTRVTRTLFDFAYKAQITNGGAQAFANVAATVTSKAAATTIMDGAVSFGTVPAGATVTSQDTFTIRQDRTVPFNPADLTWTVRANRAPVADAGSDQTAPVKTEVTLDGLASTDPDGDALTYAWRLVQKPAGSQADLLDSTTAQPWLTPDKAGEYVVELVVNDGKENSAPDTVTVSTLNSKPVAGAGPDQEAHVGKTVTLDGSGSSDVDGDTLGYAWTLIGRPADSAATLSDPAAIRLSFTVDTFGAYTAQLIVNDGTADSDPDSVTINTDNTPPVADAGPDQRATVGDTVTLNGGRSSDADHAPLTYKWALTRVPVGSAAELAGDATVNPSFTADQAGAYVAQLIVNDGTVDSDPDTVTISTENSKPVANAGPDQAAEVGDEVTLEGSDSTDADHDPLTYQWSLTTRPDGSAAALDNPTRVDPRFVPDKAGLYVAQLIVNDGTADSDPPDTVLVNVTTQTPTNRNPQITSTPATTATAGQAYGYPVTATDPDNDPLTYHLTTAPVDMTINVDTGVIEWMPSQVGSADVTVQVKDPGGLADTQSFKITVTAAPPPANRNPQITSTPVTAAAAGQAYGYPVTATDPDSDPLTFFLQSAPAGMSIDAASGAIQWTPQANQAGTHEVAVLVNDGRGGTATQSFTVQVSAAGNLSPVANPDRYETRLGETLTVPAPGVLGNDVAPNGGALTAAQLTDPTKGILSLFNADGGFTYQAPPTLPGPVFQPVVKAKADNSHGMGYAPTVVDVDRDGIPEIITDSFTGGGGITVWHLKDGVLQQLWNRTSFPAPFNDCIGPISGIPQPIAAGDIDDSGEIALVFPAQCSRDQSGGLGQTARYMAVNGRDGAPKWLSPTMSEVRNPDGNAYPMTWTTIPLITRRHSGESPSIVFGVDLHYSLFAGKPLCDQVVPGWPAYTQCRAVFVLDGKDGTLRQKMAAEGYISTVSQTTAGNPAVVAADLEGNGKLNFVYGASVFNPDGSTRWNVTDPNKGAKTWWNGLGNFDDTPDIEIVRLEGRADDYVVRLAVYKADGRLLWRTPSIAGGSPDNGIPVVADVDGSGRPAVVLNLQQYVCAIDYRGQYKWCYDGGVDAVPHNIGWRVRIAVYDLDGDGVPEVIVPLFNERLVFLDGATGAVKYDFDMAAANGPPVANRHSGPWGSPLVADFAGNGHASILSLWAGYGVSRMNLVGAQNDDWQPARGIFNQTSYHVGNVEDDGTIPPSFVNNFATPATNVFGTQAQVLKPVDPRLKTQTTFTYQASSGALDSAPATVTIDIQPQNRPPKFVSTPPTRWSGVRGSTFDYAAQAVDPDVGDTLTYSIGVVSGNNPVCTIQPTTGAFHCTPLWQGDFAFVIVATDSQGAKAYQTISLIASTGAAAVPDVVGQPQATAETTITGAGFTVGDITSMHNAAPAGQVLAQSPAAGTSTLLGDRIALTISKGPAPGNVPDAVGQTQAEAEAAIVAAGLQVGAVSTAPSATLAAGRVIAQTPAPGANVAPGTAVNLVVSSGIVSLQGLASLVVEPATPFILVGQNQAFTATGVFADGASLNLTGMVTWTSGTPAVASLSAAGVAAGLTAGTTPIRATVNGITGGADLTVGAFAPGDATEPTAALTAPTDGAEVTGPVDVTGTATDANFLKYELAYAPAGETHFTVLATGATPVTNGVLGKLDPTLLLNDQYTLRLTVYDRGGNISEASVTVQVTRDLKVGLFSITFQDLGIALSGLPITVNRTYDSRDKGQGDFGVGWRLDLQTLRLRTNRVLGTGWVRSQAGANINLSPTSPHKVSITLPDGKVEEFDLQVSPTSGFGALDQTRVVGFAPRPGTLGALEALANGNLWIVNAGAADELVDDVTFNTYDPQLYRYTTVDGARIEIHRTEGVKKVTDLNGNTLTFGPGGIIHSSGKSVTFTRDAQGRITRITDPMGHVQSYGYDANGDLISHTDAVGNVSRYAYNRSHGLIDIQDPAGNRAARNEYDPQGRLIATTDARGNRIEFTHDTAASREVVRDRLGNITLFDYDAVGNVVAKTDALGQRTTYTFDSRGNPLTETDPLGRVARKTYDAQNNVLTRTDFDGNTTTYTYNARGQMLTTTDPEGRVTTQVYDGNGNLTQVTDPEGGVTRHRYDAAGRRLATTDPLGNVTAFAYDAAGNQISETDPLGTVTASTYNASGSLLSVTRAGVQTRYEYDAAQRVIRVIDPLGQAGVTTYSPVGDGKKPATVTDVGGRLKRFDYDASGNLIRTTFADGSTELKTYDAEGRVLGTTDRDGQTTAFQYDAVGRQTRITHPDGATVVKTYDAAGRLLTQTDERGNATTYSYASNAQTVTDALGQATVHRFDSQQHIVQTTDSASRVTRYAYDSRGNRTKTTFPDATTQTTGYDAAGRRIAETDAAGQTTQFAYDAVGRLVQVTDATGGVTRHGYDARGNRVTQTDANGHRTDLEYDALGRLTRRTRPLGQFETFAYDALGNTTSHSDFNGQTTTFAYDSNNRLTGKTLPGGAVVAYAYTPEGRRTQAGGDRYRYDARGRLLGETKASGDVLAYTYDAAGNRTAVTTPQGTTTYTYDALNRMATVADATGSTAYAYDAVGNLASTTYPNGVQTVYGYDALNRLVQMTNSGPSGLVSSYAYTLGPAGNRLQVVEAGPATTGRTVHYTYDAVHRLIQERIDEPGTANDQTIGYVYDAVGNRLQQDRNGSVTTSTYDANDRLLAETTGGVTETFAYDDNGNRLRRTAGGATDTYAYDAENRLVSANPASGAVSYTYDADGMRTSKTAGGVTTKFLLDKNRDYAQVLLETTGATTATYTYGNQLISQTRPGTGTRFHLYDGQLSTRQLASTTGSVTDAYAYDAFGVLLAATGSTPNVYLYAGEQLDPNVGFYYLRARYYNPAQGRFITTDPEEGNIFDSVSLHRYLYANANPIQFTDPSGRVSLVEGAVVAAVLVPIAAVGVWVSETLKRNARKGQALPNPNEYRAERKALEYDYGAETEFMDIFTAYQTWAKIEPNKSIKGLCDYLKVSQNVVNKFSLVVLEHRAARTQHLIALWTAIGAPEPITVRLSLDWTDEREQYKTTPTIWEKKLSEYTNVTPQVCPP